MKRISAILFALIIVVACACPVFATDTSDYLVDDAQLLSSSEYSDISQKLETNSEKLKFDIAIVTKDGIGDKTPEEYTDDYFIDNGYGYGDNGDGCLFMVDMDSREWHISTHGYGITAITDAGLDYMSDKFESDLTDGNYADAFNTYINYVVDYVNQARDGHPVDTGNLPKDFGLIEILISLGVGAVIAGVVTCILKGQLKTVAHKAEANDYYINGSLNLTRGDDRFITAAVSKTKRAKSDSDGGSSTHSSSSGDTFGGGGGSF